MSTGKLYLIDVDNTLLDCLGALEKLYVGYSKEQQLTYDFNIDGVPAKDVIANFFSKDFYKGVTLNKSVLDFIKKLSLDDKVIFVTYGDKDAKEYKVLELLDEYLFKCRLANEVISYPSGGKELEDFLDSGLELGTYQLSDVVAVDDSPARLDAYKVKGVPYVLVNYRYNDEYREDALEVLRG